MTTDPEDLANLLLAAAALAALVALLRWNRKARKAKLALKRGPKTWEIVCCCGDFEVVDASKPEDVIGLWDSFHDAAVHACDLAKDGDTIILPAGSFNIEMPMPPIGRGVRIVGGSRA